LTANPDKASAVRVVWPAYRVARNKNDWNIDLNFGQLGLKIESAQSRQSDIQYRQLTLSGNLLRKNSSADPNGLLCKLTDSKTALNPSRTSGSSSIMSTIGS
jgi:hypothetical protein